MEASTMKNMVVLRNLPSNMVEEAIIIFKETQTIKEKELVDKNNKINFTERQSKSKECILKEAELLVTDYIDKIENKKQEKATKNINKKYKKLKKYSIISTALLAISIIINFI